MNPSIAIKRSRLSRPLRLALESGVLSRGQSYFDYGEGRGDDVRLLRRRRFKASGWDPHHSPKKARKRADVVGLVFVLNIIASTKERAQALRSAAELAKKSLLVAVRTDKASGKPYRDGVATAATFQRNYEPQEVQSFIRRTLKREPRSIAPGVYVVDMTTKPAASKPPVKPNKTRKISQACRAYYDGDRSKMPLSHFLEKDRDYPYRTRDGRIDCNLVSAAIKRARLNKGRGVRGSAATLKKAQAIWSRVCAKYTDGASQ